MTIGFDGMPGWGEPLAAESRAIGATCGGVRIWSLYVPNGRKPDDPHYVYKLDWLARLREAAKPWLDGTRPRWSATGTSARPTTTSSTRQQFTNSTHVTPPERAAFQAFLDDGYAEVDPPPTPAGYTYWDYYRQRFERDRGLQDRLRARRPRRWPSGSPARSSTARSGPGRAPPTTPRWSSTSTD